MRWLLWHRLSRSARALATGRICSGSGGHLSLRQTCCQRHSAARTQSISTTAEFHHGRTLSRLLPHALRTTRALLTIGAPAVSLLALQHGSSACMLPGVRACIARGLVQHMKRETWMVSVVTSAEHAILFGGFTDCLPPVVCRQVGSSRVLNRQHLTAPPSCNALATCLSSPLLNMHLSTHMLFSDTESTGVVYGNAQVVNGPWLVGVDNRVDTLALVALALMPSALFHLVNRLTGLHRDHTLFLCYPPPASKMAEEALAAYTGDTVALVGEWDGDTGRPEFTRALLRGWSLQEAIPLPNWSDTAHDLTLWTRRDAVLRPESVLDAAPWPVCSSTGVWQCLSSSTWLTLPHSPCFCAHWHRYGTLVCSFAFSASS